MIKKISSPQNPLVKHFLKLRKDRKYRQECGTVVVEGKKLVNELCLCSQAKNILFTDPALLAQPVHMSEQLLVTEQIIQKISGLETPEGIMAEFPIPRESDLNNIQFLVALDGVSDPGNMGTILRSALALGWDGAFLLNNCCDPFNDKALRSAKGATFRLPLKSGNWRDLNKIVKDNGLQPLAADVEGKDAGTLSVKKALLVLGSEANGLSEETLKHCQKITIPMSGKMESLNVSAAAGIILYLLKISHSRC